MNRTINQKDVFLYHANLLGPDRCRQIETACETDEQVRGWFDDLNPTRIPHIEPSEFELSNPEFARLLATAYEIVASEDRFNRLLDWAQKPTPALPEAFPETGRLFTLASAMVLRDPIGLAGRPIRTTPIECPCIYTNYKLRLVTVRQSRDALPPGLVDIIVVRLRGSEEPVTFRLEGYKLKPADDCWWDDIPMRLVLPEAEGRQPGDELVYVVRAAAGTATANHFTLEGE